MGYVSFREGTCLFVHENTASQTSDISISYLSMWQPCCPGYLGIFELFHLPILMSSGGFLPNKGSLPEGKIHAMFSDLMQHAGW